MAKRIKASKLLAKDPNDYEARHLLKEADDQATFSIFQIITVVLRVQAVTIKRINFSVRCSFGGMMEEWLMV